MMQCPKCQGPMRTVNRSGVQIEQCGDCRGIFLDYGELEHLSQFESQFMAAPQPPMPGGGHGGHGGPAWGRKGHRRGGWSSLFYSS